jgi:hypothetical protein
MRMKNQMEEKKNTGMGRRSFLNTAGGAAAALLSAETLVGVSHKDAAGNDSKGRLTMALPGHCGRSLK